MEANNILLKIKYKDLYDIKFKIDAITPDTMNLSICWLFIFKNLYKAKLLSFNLFKYKILILHKFDSIDQKNK